MNEVERRAVAMLEAISNRTVSPDKTELRDRFGADALALALDKKWLAPLEATIHEFAAQVTDWDQYLVQSYDPDENDFPTTLKIIESKTGHVLWYKHYATSDDLGFDLMLCMGYRQRLIDEGISDGQ